MQPLIDLGWLVAILAAGAGVYWLIGVARYSVTRRLALIVALLAPLWLLSGAPIGLAIATTASLAVVLVMFADAMLLPGRRSLEVTREVPPTVGVGETVEGIYRVRSAVPRALRVSLHDRLPRAVVKTAETPGTHRLAPRGQLLFPVAVAGRERGVHALGPVSLQVTGTLGLVQRLLHRDLDDSITVAPSLAGVRRYRLLALQHRLQDAGVRNIRRRGEGTTFANLREYALGDDPRHVDWKATARRRKLITREYTVEQGQTVMIAIDAGRLMTQLSGQWSRFEYALSAALVLADVAVHSGDRVGLILFDDEVRAFVAPVRGRAALQLIREALIPAQARLVEPDYAAAFRTLAARYRRRSLVVTFTDVIDVRASQALIAHTTRSVARHLPVVVALRNDELTAAATASGRTTTQGLYEAAAAEELVAAREAALQRMRQAGVSVVDTSPQKMSAAVVNRYLEVKARATL
ncbi:MAG TPA: DUF58 domain-containing protein [Gemmatimonadaceae bacterium]|nr:DUF58 domain-containing protein [Gemmatimonadaceae bacterium]